MCGLCGNADGDISNDYVTSSGDAPSGPDDWGTSYQIEEYDSTWWVILYHLK